MEALEPLQLLWLFLGWVAYTGFKIGAVLKGNNSIVTFKDFAAVYWLDLLLSLVAIIFIATAAPELPEKYGKFDTPVNLFIAGGAAPSMISNIISNYISR